MSSVSAAPAAGAASNRTDLAAHRRAIAEALPAGSGVSMAAGGDELLTQREAAALLRVSVAYLRASSCPKILLPGRGDRGKPLVRYLRSDVLAWAIKRRT